MATGSAWQTLGIAPTEDKRAIKRAYAAKLKATDVEGDPRAFIALREALETATWEADYLQYQDQQGEDVGLADAEPIAVDLEPIRDDELAIAEHEYDPDDEDEDPATWRWEPERQPETEADQERIVQLLWGDAPVDEIEVELAERTHNILTAPAMEAIDHASGIEDWMASIIAQSIPRSDVMARIAVPHFGWEEHADDWRQRYGVAAAAARLRDLDALDRLSRPDHRWNAAFELLRQPPPDAKGWKAVTKHKADVLGLLESIRHHTPALEHELNADHVAQWEPALAASGATVKKKSGGGGLRWYWWLFIFLMGVAQFARFAADPVPPPGPPSPETLYNFWRAEQMPDVQQRMDANRAGIDKIIATKSVTGLGFPTCASLNEIVRLTDEQRAYCELNQLNRRPLAGPAVTQVPAATATYRTEGDRSSKLLYSSPQWRGEQAMRIQIWMDQNPEEVDRLLRPHVKKGGLPSCAILEMATFMTPAERAQCDRGEAARRAARVPSSAEPKPPTPTLPPKDEDSPPVPSTSVGIADLGVYPLDIRNAKA